MGRVVVVAGRQVVRGRWGSAAFRACLKQRVPTSPQHSDTAATQPPTHRVHWVKRLALGLPPAPAAAAGSATATAGAAASGGGAAAGRARRALRCRQRHLLSLPQPAVDP